MSSINSAGNIGTLPHNKPASNPGTNTKPSRPILTPPSIPNRGVKIIGTGHALPSRLVTNDDIAAICGSDDAWIQQRTGIKTRRVCDPAKGEGNLQLCTVALTRALEDAKIKPTELDLIICGTITQDMRCPAQACMLSNAVGAGNAQAWDLAAACCSFVYGINVAQDIIRVGTHKTIAVLGSDAISSITDYTNRNVSILFGDAAGAAILRATDDATKGCIVQINAANGQGWTNLYIPTTDSQILPEMDRDLIKPGCLHMNGREVFKFAVGTFQNLIGDTLAKAGITVDDVDMFVCHQSNKRIIDAAVEKFGIPQDKVYINIDRIGNTSGGSVPVCLDELRKAGRIRDGHLIMFVAFGAGLTWSSSLWQL